MDFLRTHLIMNAPLSVDNFQSSFFDGVQKLMTKMTKVHSELNDFLRNPYFKDTVDFLTLNIPGVADGLQIQAVPDMDFTSDPYLPGNVMSLLQSGQFDKNIEVIFGNNADEGIFVTGPQTHGFTEWDEYRETFEIEGTAMLFGIANKSDIKNEDFEKMSELVSYYVGSIDNINKEHQQGNMAIRVVEFSNGYEVRKIFI